MKKLCVIAVGLCAVSISFAQTNVGVSIGINQPGVYGQINIDNYPAPRVINQRPIVIVQSQVREPLYLYVPPGHQKHWDKHCRDYEACGRPVYFVREDWVRERYNQDRREGGDRGSEHGRGDDNRKKHKHDKD